VATIGCDPATKVSLGGAAAASTTAAGCASAVTGLNGGGAGACLVSGCLVAAGVYPFGCGFGRGALGLGWRGGGGCARGGLGAGSAQPDLRGEAGKKSFRLRARRRRRRC